MKLLNKIRNGFKAVIQLDPYQIFNYLKYQSGLRSGYYHLRTPSASINRLLPESALTPVWFMLKPEINAFSHIDKHYENHFIEIAEEILQGRIQLFGANSVPLDFSIPGASHHWTLLETGKIKLSVEDIKFLWEPARFGWAINLGIAYHFTRQEKYSERFWQYLEEFTHNSPLNIGPNWQSSQEVALRLIALVITLNLIQPALSSDSKKSRGLVELIADHAERILPTLSYAKAQNNNHLVSEAVGLYTAGIFLPQHPRSASWKRTGLKIFDQAIKIQVSPDGEYIQHSTNYQRMFLMLALWMQYLLKAEGKDFNDISRKNLALASTWLTGHLDPLSGRVPNLGHNDGSNILHFSKTDYSDYRPVIQASNRAFLSKAALPAGEWDDLCVWLGLPYLSVLPESIDFKRSWGDVRIGTPNSWASMRAVRYINRPAHADQLHVEIWHKGFNIACDSGTYLYNAAAPWNNQLSSTLVHNTISIDRHDQMTRASRFLWLDWSKAKISSNKPNILNGIHDGYLKYGIIHKRKLEQKPNEGWLITDKLIQVNGKKNIRTILLNWQLPDWQYELEGNALTFSTPFGFMRFELFTQNGIIVDGLNVIRSGMSLMNKVDSIIHGWYSPTYGIKQPALSVQYSVSELLPIEITTRFSFRENNLDH